MRWLFSLPVLLSLFFIFPTHAQTNETPLPLTINANGTLVASDADPKIISGRTLLPLRAAAEAVHAEVMWNHRTNQATIKKGGITLVFTLNKGSFVKNGKSIALDFPLKQYDNRLYLPIRAFSEALNIPIHWDAKRRIVSLGDKETYQEAVTPFPQNANLLLEKYTPRVVTRDNLVGTWLSSNSDRGESSLKFIHPMKDNLYKVINVEINENNLEKQKAVVIYYGIGKLDAINQKLTITEDRVPKYVYGTLVSGHSSVDSVSYYDVAENALTPISSLDTKIENSVLIDSAPFSKISKSYGKEY